MGSKYKLGRGQWKTIEQGNELSWMIGNGLGGFSNSTVSGGSATCFNGYLIASMNPPVDRYLILSRTQEQINVGNRHYDFTSQQYINDSKDGQKYLKQFVFDDIPTYLYSVEDIEIKKMISMEYGKNTVVVCYDIRNGGEESIFNIVPVFNYRQSSDVSEKCNLKFSIKKSDNILTLIPESNHKVSIDFITSEGEFYDRSLIPTDMSSPNYVIEENNYYMLDNRTGFLGTDNHFTPYEVHILLKPYEKKRFYVKCTVDGIDDRDGFDICTEYKDRINGIVKNAGYDDDFANNLIKASDHFVVKRNSTGLKTVLAGFPWFTDWGRDTMIAFEGLVLVTKRFDDAREILMSFAKYMKNGLIPNMFPDENTDPLYNTVDASLWYFQAVYKYLKYTGTEEDYKFIYDNIYPKLVEIFNAYREGTDFSIGMDEDCLIHAGNGLDQVTWMDVRVGEFVVTPRHGKPVEINALWYNAVCILEELSLRFGYDSELYDSLKHKIKSSFNDKFWNKEKKCLYDVIDEDDDSIRPNQIFAVSLPFSVMSREREKQVVNTVYKHLYSVYGLKSLSFMDDRFKKEYIGKLYYRDRAYHMGTSWGFLIGPFITAYCKVSDHNSEAIKDAAEMCSVFEDHLKDGCINGIAEIFDGEFSCTGRGCYSQAWSVAEVLRSYINDVYKYTKGEER